MLGSIGIGFMVLVCVECYDIFVEVDVFLKKLLVYCVFSDEVGKMNCSVVDV